MKYFLDFRTIIRHDYTEKVKHLIKKAQGILQ